MCIIFFLTKFFNIRYGNNRSNRWILGFSNYFNTTIIDIIIRMVWFTRGRPIIWSRFTRWPFLFYIFRSFGNGLWFNNFNSIITAGCIIKTITIIFFFFIIIIKTIFISICLKFAIIKTICLEFTIIKTIWFTVFVIIKTIFIGFSLILLFGTFYIIWIFIYLLK